MNKCPKLCRGLLIVLGNLVSRLSIVNNGKVERTMYVSVGVSETNPLEKLMETLSIGVIGGVS